MRPGYLRLPAGELQRRADEALARLGHCCICPRHCGVDRLEGERGFCQAGFRPMVASWNAHVGEEPPISGSRGSGTIFFTYCSGRCKFCQNYPISQLGVGQEVELTDLAGMMLELQQRGCHNINLVTAAHFVPQFLAALSLAVAEGLRLPLVYNSSGYEELETLRLLEGIVDIYLPDAKYGQDGPAREFSGFSRYVEINRAALKEMYRQVGELELDEQGLAVRGLIIRHLVLPGGLAGTPQVLRWIAREISPTVHVSLLAQYFPAHRALGDPLLGRKLNWEEYDAAIEAFERAGLENGWLQELEEEDTCSESS
ncbi:MAG: radical SAM protein [Chloroflexia bacterium]|nr:radical SAM protein [Chloroflexia bacterium]